MTVGKRDAIKAQRTRKKRQQRMRTLLWVGGFILLLTIILVTPSIYDSLKPAGDFVTITPVAHPMADGKTIGNPQAKVVVEVHEDFQCPACKSYTDSIEAQLFASSFITNGDVYYIFRQHPFLDQNPNGESHQAANASMCALEQGKFWDYHAMLFANQGQENRGAYNDKRLVAFAEALGLNMTDFNSCFEDNKYSTEIEADYQMGIDAGIDRTPTILINGNNFFPETIPTYEQLSAAIDSAIAGGG